MYVGDLKLSHVQQDELNNIIDQLNDVFGRDGELLAVSYGKLREYLGMTIDWNIPGKVMFTLYDYLEEILVEAPLDFDGEDVTPAISEILQVNNACPKLDIAIADLFHRIVARFLYVAKMAKTDLQVAVIFLCKREKCPNIGDWKKLGRLVWYVRAIIHLPLIIR